MAAVRSTEISFDVLKSIRPLIVSIGNSVSSSEPLRDMRKKLQIKIRNFVAEVRPVIFPELPPSEKTEDIDEETDNYVVT
jgi:hypothetical protein